MHILMGRRDYLILHCCGANIAFSVFVTVYETHQALLFVVVFKHRTPNDSSLRINRVLSKH